VPGPTIIDRESPKSLNGEHYKDYHVLLTMGEVELEKVELSIYRRTLTPYPIPIIFNASS
jgi:hypothetical protein